VIANDWGVLIKPIVFFNMCLGWLSLMMLLMFFELLMWTRNYYKDFYLVSIAYFQNII